jgi:hypothetical protein
MARTTYWTVEQIVATYREFREVHSRYPKADDLGEYGLPHPEAVWRKCGSHTNACVLAFNDYRPQHYSFPDKHEDTEEVIRQLTLGRSLGTLGRERGISGQALGRRVKRYKEWKQRQAEGWVP